MTSLYTSASTGLGDLSLGTKPSLKRLYTKPEDPMETPKKSKPTQDTPRTVRVDDDGNFLPGQENLINEHDEYNKRKKYKMVPYSSTFNAQNIFVKQPDGSFVPLQKIGRMFLLEGMSKEEIQSGEQPYNYKGVKMESDNLFGVGGFKQKRMTRRKRTRSSKRKYNKSKRTRK